MHVGIANPRWRGKRSLHSRLMCNPQFCVSGKRPMPTPPPPVAKEVVVVIIASDAASNDKCGTMTTNKRWINTKLCDLWNRSILGVCCAYVLTHILRKCAWFANKDILLTSLLLIYKFRNTFPIRDTAIYGCPLTSLSNLNSFPLHLARRHYPA